MATAAKIPVLIAALLAIHPAQAADPAIRIEPAVSGSGAVELNTAPPALDGAQLFATHCAMCHKPGGTRPTLAERSRSGGSQSRDGRLPRPSRPQRCRRGYGDHRLSGPQRDAVNIEQGGPPKTGGSNELDLQLRQVRGRLQRADYGSPAARAYLTEFHSVGSASPRTDGLPQPRRGVASKWDTNTLHTRRPNWNRSKVARTKRWARQAKP